MRFGAIGAPGLPTRSSDARRCSRTRVSVSMPRGLGLVGRVREVRQHGRRVYLALEFGSRIEHNVLRGSRLVFPELPRAVPCRSAPGVDAMSAVRGLVDDSVRPRALHRVRPHESVQLFERYQRDRRTTDRDQLVARYMPLAQHLARRYSTAAEKDDLQQVAALALIKAVERFDPYSRHRVHIVRRADDPGRAQALLPRPRLGGASAARCPGT